MQASLYKIWKNQRMKKKKGHVLYPLKICSQIQKT